MPLFPLIDDVPDQWFAESLDKDSGIVSTVNILLVSVVAGYAAEYSFKQGFSCESTAPPEYSDIRDKKVLTNKQRWSNRKFSIAVTYINK